MTDESKTLADEIVEAMRGMMVSVLPAAPGTILVLTPPEVFDWRNPAVLARMQQGADILKEIHGFASVIIVEPGFTLQSLDLDTLARIGLQPIPRGDSATDDSLRDREPEGSA